MYASAFLHTVRKTSHTQYWGLDLIAQDYMVLSLLTLGGMYLTNWALNYLNYATRIMFKSSKVVPTMIVGTFIQGRRYTIAEYAAAGVLVLGIILFTIGDKEAYPYEPPSAPQFSIDLRCDLEGL